MGVFDVDFTVADELFAEAFGKTVSLKRSNVTTAGVISEVVSHDFNTFDSYTAQTGAQSRTYLFNVDDYAFGGVTSIPQRGDEIRETIDGKVHVFEVMPTGAAPCYQWEGADKPQWRVHAKLVGIE